jgi:Flp pilus assembly pilin Flp
VLERRIRVTKGQIEDSDPGVPGAGQPGGRRSGERGATLVEYTLMVCLIGSFSIMSMTVLGRVVSGSLGQAVIPATTAQQSPGNAPSTTVPPIDALTTTTTTVTTTTTAPPPTTTTCSKKDHRKGRCRPRPGDGIAPANS